MELIHEAARLLESGQRISEAAWPRPQDAYSYALDIGAVAPYPRYPHGV